MSGEALVELQRVFLNVEEADRGQLDQVSCMTSLPIGVENVKSLFGVIIKELKMYNLLWRPTEIFKISISLF